MGKWKNFELELPSYVEKSEYLAIHIHFDSAYKWGEGWNSEEAVQNYGSWENAYDAWHNEIRAKFQEAGYYIEDNIESCDMLRESSSSLGYNKETLDIYIHPMEFTGYATQNQLDDIVNILQHCDTVRNICVHTAQQTYSLNDYQYEKVLDNNAEQIVRHICENYKPKDRFSEEIAFDFAREARIPRAGAQRAALVSDDTDIKYVKRLADFCQKFDVYKKIDKEIKKEKSDSEHNR